jgi:hypothetical protein
MATTRKTETTVVTLNQYWPSLFKLSGGRRVYLLDTTRNKVYVYVPPPVAGTMLTFVHTAGTNVAGLIQSSKAPIAGLATPGFSLTEYNEGEGGYTDRGAVTLVAGSDGYWHVANRTTVLT